MGYNLGAVADILQDKLRDRLAAARKRRWSHIGGDLEASKSPTDRYVDIRTLSRKTRIFIDRGALMAALKLFPTTKETRDADVAGALFDFAAYLSGGKTIKVGKKHSPSILVTLLRKFAQARGLDLDSANVRAWERGLEDSVCREALLHELRDAVIWMSGSGDFAVGGKARKGWLKAREGLMASLQ